MSSRTRLAAVLVGLAVLLSVLAGCTPEPPAALGAGVHVFTADW